MDKLKPIITHRFWILAGLALLLPIIGWWSSTSAMVQDFKKRSEELNTSFSSAKIQPGPNQKWIEPIKVLNGEETHKVEDTRTLLWDHQLPLMAEWPSSIAADMKDLDPKAEIDATVRNKYRTLYGMEMKRLWRIPKPYDEIEKTGRVIFPEEGVLPVETWPENPFPPSTKVMRDSQEDIWLLQALLEAIDAVNEDNGAPNLMDSAIREIRVIQLRGGSKDKPKPAVAATAGPPGSAGKTAAASMPMPRGAGPTSMGGMPTTGAGAPGADGASIDLQEVFGPDEEKAGPASPAPGGANAPRPPGPAPAAAGPSSGGHGGGATSSAMGGLSVMNSRADAPKKRYIEENEQYRTRGFYVVVTMDQMQVPNLITKLSNMPWSAKIVRVHQVDHDRSDVPPSGGNGRTGAQTMGGMGNMGGRPTMPRPQAAPRPMPAAGGEAGSAGASGNEMAAAMSDPALVDVAIAGIFTLYLPPPPPPPAAPGAPAPAGPTAPGTPAPAATAAATETPAEEMTEPEGEGEATTAEEMPAAADADKGDDAEMEKADSEPAAESGKGAEKPAGKPKPAAKPAAEDDT